MIRFDENGRRDKRTRWSVDHAPLRIAFGRELAGAKSCDWVLPRGWVDSPASGNSSERRLFTRLLTWEEMAFLGCHLDQMDLPAQACDEDGKWWVSGYRLYAAGLIDDASTLLVELSAEQSKKMFGTPTPSAFDFMVHGLRCYADQLWTLIMVADVWAHHYFALGDPAGRASQLRWRAARWRREVIDWLAEHGIEDPPPRVGIVPRSQHNRLPKDVPASGEVIRLAGGVIELVDLAGLPDSVRRDVVRIQKGEGLGGLRKLLEGEDCDSAIN